MANGRTTRWDVWLPLSGLAVAVDFWSRAEAVADFHAVWAAAREVLSVAGDVLEIVSPM